GHAARIRGRAAIDGSDPPGPGPVTGRSSWSWLIRHALCRYVSLDPDQWFPASAEAEPARHEAAAAIAICHGCPPRAPSLPTRAGPARGGARPLGPRPVAGPGLGPWATRTPAGPSPGPARTPRVPAPRGPEPRSP